jgi:ABC-type multidrug transport system permease subunit
MPKIAKIIKKDLKLLMRSKTSSLVVIFAPLLVMLLVGAAFNNTNQYSVSISVYSNSYSDLVESFIQTLSDQGYTIIKAQSDDSCRQNVKQGSSHICIIFPPDLSANNNNQQEVNFIADYSRVNLIYMVVDSLSSDLDDQTEAISLGLTQNLLSKIESTKNSLSTTTSTLSELSTKNSEVTAKNNEQSSNLIQISTSLDTSKTNIDQISIENANIKTGISSFKTGTYTKLLGIREQLTSISDIIDTLGNLSDNKHLLIQDDINSSRNITDNIEQELNSSVNLTETSKLLIDEQTQQLKQNIDNTKAILATLTSNTDSMKQSLEETTSKTASIQDATNAILTDLGTIQVTSAEKIATPIVTKIQPLLSEKTHLTYILSGLIALVIMFISLLLSTTIVMMEKTSPSYFRNFISPTPDIIFIISTYLSTLIIVLIQMVIILGISALVFENIPLANLLNIYLAVVIITTVFTLIGMLVGYAFSSQETSILASISFGSIFLLLSNMILPLESMPIAIRDIAQYNPFVLSETILKSTTLYNTSLTAVQSEVLLLLAISFVIFVFILFLHSILKKHLIHRISYKHKHNKASSAKQVDKLLIKADSELNHEHKDNALRYYAQALKLYKTLVKNKDPTTSKIYNDLKSMSSKLKIGQTFK